MIKNLVMLRMRAVFGAMASKDKNGAYKKLSALKIVLISLLYLYLFAVFGFLSVMISLSIGSLFILGGESEIFFALINALSFSLIFILSIFETKSELFDCKDNNLLLSMPIPSGSIVIARMIVVLIYNFITEAIIIIPASIIYLVLSGGELLGFLGSLITGIFVPLAATALAAAVGYLVAMISKRMKNKTFITVILSLGFLALYFIGYTALLSVEGDGTEVDISAILAKLSFLKPIGAASMLSPLPLIIFVAVCSAIAYIAYRIISYHYITIVTQDHSLKRTEYKASEAKNTRPVLAIAKKEISKFFSSATYMLNAAIGLVFEPVIAIFAIFKSADILFMIEGLIGETGIPVSTDSFVAAAISAGAVLLSSTVTISSSSVSLEGKNLWVMKSMPIDTKTILRAKALAHIVITVPVAIVSVIIISMAMSLSPIYTIGALICVTAVNVFSAFLGVVLNTAFPKFVYENEAQPIKQSLATFLSMMSMMLLGMIMLIVGMVMALLSLGGLFVIITAVLFIGLSIGFYFIMIYPSAKRYESFSVV